MATRRHGLSCQKIPSDGTPVCPVQYVRASHGTACCVAKCHLPDPRSVKWTPLFTVWTSLCGGGAQRRVHHAGGTSIIATQKPSRAVGSCKIVDSISVCQCRHAWRWRRICSAPAGNVPGHAPGCTYRLLEIFNARPPGRLGGRSRRQDDRAQRAAVKAHHTTRAETSNFKKKPIDSEIPLRTFRPIRVRTAHYLFITALVYRLLNDPPTGNFTV